jgi:hypothetical protein
MTIRIERERMHLGMPVCTTDGHQLGTIDEIRLEHFKVAAPRQRDYWLELETVAGIEGDRAILCFPEDSLDSYRMSDPGAPGSLPASPTQPARVPGEET